MEKSAARDRVAVSMQADTGMVTARAIRLAVWRRLLLPGCPAPTDVAQAGDFVINRIATTRGNFRTVLYVVNRAIASISSEIPYTVLPKHLIWPGLMYSH